MARDVQRKCTICGNEGRAEKMSEREAKQPPLVGRGLTRRPQDLARQSMHEAKLATFTRSSRCTKCGSTQVTTVRSRSKPQNSATLNGPTPSNVAPPPQVPASKQPRSGGLNVDIGMVRGGPKGSPTDTVRRRTGMVEHPRTGRSQAAVEV